MTEELNLNEVPGDVKVTIRELISTNKSADYCYKQAKKYIQNNNVPKGKLVIENVSYPEAMNWIKDHPNVYLKVWHLMQRNTNL
ncbi:hypothetical protein FVI60_09045 [Campylobacter jejuni]|nr:hypothetical protein [Campylobacter jejuni]